jgi:hypothetical protein
MHNKRGENEKLKFFHSSFFSGNHKGQITIFIIIAIIIIAAVIGFFIFRQRISPQAYSLFTIVFCHVWKIKP